MANRVNVNITARDLTRGELARIRGNFRGLGQDMDRAISQRTRQNFDRLGQSISQARRNLDRMRGSIPDDEFFRLDDAMRQAQRRMQRGFGRTSAAGLQRIAAHVREVEEGFRRLDQTGQIRVRVDDSALRRADARLAAWRRDQQRNAVRIPIRPDADRNLGRRIGASLVRHVTGPVRTLGRITGGILSDGVGQGIIGGFRAAGPIGIAILATAIASAVSVIGAALGGVLILALGGAFAILGGVIAAKSKEVKDAWAGTLEELKPLFRDAAQPMIPVLLHGIALIEEMGKKFAPIFRDFLAEAAPQLEDFFDSLAKGFEKFGKAGWDDITEGFRVFLDAFGPQWEGFMESLGESFGALGRTVSEHSTEIAIALRVVLQLFVLLVDAVNFLANAWAQGMRTMSFAIGLVLKAVGTLVTGALTGWDLMLAGFQRVAEQIPGMSGKGIGQAREHLRQYRDDAAAKFSQMGQSAMDFGKRLDQANKRRKLEVNIESWSNRLSTARSQLKRTTDQKARAKLTANIADLINKVSHARRELNSLNGKTARTYVTTHYSTSGKGISEIPFAAHGGVIGTAATGGVRSNMTLVGENGPEVVDLAPGSHVRSNPDTRRLMGGGGGGGGPAQFVFKSSGRRVDDMLIEILREAIQQRGGDPVIVLGG